MVASISSPVGREGVRVIIQKTKAKMDSGFRRNDE